MDIIQDDMPNKHLEHPEDTIFDGRRVALKAITEMITCKTVGIKWDGAPAVVFGTNPANGKFFVGTKSVFNKKIPKINYSFSDIETNHKGDVADILRLLFHFAPRVNSIIQADWIGVGGSHSYTPNTLEYRFPTQVPGYIVIAPHTFYEQVSADSVGHIGINLASSPTCYCVSATDAWAFVEKELNFTDQWKSFIPIFRSKTPHPKVAPKIKQHVNSFIREGRIADAQEMYDSLPDKYKGEVSVYTFKAWHYIYQLKQRLQCGIRESGDVECYIDGEPSKHEGYVINSKNPYKIVDRLTFSRANFNLRKNWKNEKV